MLKKLAERGKPTFWHDSLDWPHPISRNMYGHYYRLQLWKFWPFRGGGGGGGGEGALMGPLLIRHSSPPPPQSAPLRLGSGLSKIKIEKKFTRFWVAVQSLCGSRWVASQNGVHLYCIVFIYTLTVALNASKRGFIAKEYVTWWWIGGWSKVQWLQERVDCVGQQYVKCAGVRF